MIAWFTALALTSTPTAFPSLRNGDFSQGPAAWQIDNKPLDERFTVLNGRARLRTPAGTPAGTMVIAIQKVDATSLRGKSVELAARVRVHQGSAGIRFAAAHDNPTRRLVRSISPAGAVPKDGRWHVVRLHGRIGDDADYLNVGLYCAGPTNVDFDDVRLGFYTPPSKPMSPYAATVLTTALEKIHQLHVNARNNENWPKMAAQARRDAAGAQTTADIAPAISALLGDLNEHHASLWTPEDTQASAASQRSNSFPRPSVTLIDGKFGLVKLPGFNLEQPADVPLAKSYIRTVRGGLESLDTIPVCGWIVDVRGNNGGTTHVMASAVAGLALFNPKDWPDEYDEYFYKTPTYSWIADEPQQELKQGAKPVAVLIDSETGSAGEDTALRFVGRPLTRTYGSPTAGYTSANESIDLADGYALVIPSTYMHDRHGNVTKDRLIPDQETEDPLGAAKRWLSSQCK